MSSPSPKIPPNWIQAISIFSRLPPELRIEIYSLTLLSTSPITILPSTLHLGPYLPQEDSKVSSQALINTLNFHIWSPFAIFSEVAHAYFLRHNRFTLSNRGAARTFTNLTANLQKEDGSPVLIKSLEVVVGPDPANERDRCAYLDQGQIADPGDFDEGDGRHPGLRALRILKPLLQLPRLGEVRIKLFQHYHDIIFISNNHFNNGLLLVSGVIARIKERVVATPGSGTGGEGGGGGGGGGFVVTVQDAGSDDDEGNRTDMSHLWDGTKGEEGSELEAAERYDVVWQEYLALDKRVKKKEYELYWCRVYRDTLGLDEEGESEGEGGEGVEASAAEEQEETQQQPQEQGEETLALTSTSALASASTSAPYPSSDSDAPTFTASQATNAPALADIKLFELDELRRLKQLKRDEMDALPAAQLDGSDIFIRPLVERLASDPEWEVRAEELAKRRPREWFYDGVIGRKRLEGKGRE